jgi:hypothetical protein
MSAKLLSGLALLALSGLGGLVGYNLAPSASRPVVVTTATTPTTSHWIVSTYECDDVKCGYVK